MTGRAHVSAARVIEAADLVARRVASAAALLRVPITGPIDWAAAAHEAVSDPGGRDALVLGLAHPDRGETARHAMASLALARLTGDPIPPWIWGAVAAAAAAAEGDR